MSKKLDKKRSEKTTKQKGRKLTLSRETIRSLSVRSAILAGVPHTASPTGCDPLTTKG